MLRLPSKPPQPSLTESPLHYIQPSLTAESTQYLNHHSQLSLHTTSAITHSYVSTLPQPSLTAKSPHYLNHHSHSPLHTTSAITHTVSLRSLTPYCLNHCSPPHFLNRHSPTHYVDHHSRPRDLNHHLRVCLHTTSTITHS